jgi:hypothetical protein
VHYGKLCRKWGYLKKVMVHCDIECLDHVRREPGLW